MGSHFCLQGVFPTQGWNPGLLHCRQILYRLNHQGSLGLNLQILTLQHAVPAVSYLLSLMNKISWYSFPAPLFVYLGSRHRAHTHTPTWAELHISFSKQIYLLRPLKSLIELLLSLFLELQMLMVLAGALGCEKHVLRVIQDWSQV